MGERYEVRGKLGRGGMSTVYRAYDTVMGREVALKRLLDLEDTNLNEDSKGALEREAAALAQFQHPNVVTVFALEEDADGPFVAMELVEGEDFNEVVKDAALSVEDFIDVAEQCLDALASAGEINLLHRDIKPANIMLTMTPSDRFLVKILDFGLAKFSQQPSTQTLDHQGSFLGSIDYIAPEQLELKPLDQRTDLYSLGCVFYCGLTQESAFQGGNPAETSMNHINHRCTPIQEIRPDLPEPIAAWVMRLISRDPDDRPADAKDAMKQFQDAVKGIPYGGDEHSEVPFAAAVGGPVPVELCEPEPPQTGPTRTIQTGPTKTIQTGPTRTIQTGPTLTVQTGPTRSIQTGAIKGAGVSRPAAGAARPVTGATSVRSYGKRAADDKAFPVVPVAAGALGVLAVIFVIIFSGGRDEDGEKPVAEVAAPKKEVVEQKVSFFPKPSTSELAYPQSLSLAEGARTIPALAVSDGLVGRFSSSHGTLGRDYQSEARIGERIAAWYNLAGSDPLASLLRDYKDTEGNTLPLLKRYTPEILPGLKMDRRGVLLTNLTSMDFRNRTFDFPQGFSFVAAMALELGQDKFFRISRNPWDSRMVALGTDSSGAVYAGIILAPGEPWQKIDIGWWDREPGTIGYVCDFVNKRHQLFKIEKDGKEASSGFSSFEGDLVGVNKYAIGRRQIGTDYENPDGQILFEMAVYNRALEPGEMTRVQRQLFKRYFTSEDQ